MQSNMDIIIKSERLVNYSNININKGLTSLPYRYITGLLFKLEYVLIRIFT